MVPSKCDECPCGPIWTKCQYIDSMADDDKGIPKPGEKCPWRSLAIIRQIGIHIITELETERKSTRAWVIRQANKIVDHTKS